MNILLPNLMCASLKKKNRFVPRAPLVLVLEDRNKMQRHSHKNDAICDNKGPSLHCI